MNFFEYLYNNGDTPANFSLVIPKHFAPRRKIYEGFSDKEIDKLLSVPDTTTPTGKRDYAIFMLAFHTGLRACDVSNLKRKDIFWHTNEIKVVQTKTEVALTLPLPIECGNAIADYILNARPESDEPYIFLRALAPYHRLKNRSISCIVARCMNRAGIENNSVRRLGLHSFRRFFGKHMLESKVPFDLVGEMLGQTRMNSLTPYIAIDEGNIQNCALGLIPCEKAGDA